MTPPVAVAPVAALGVPVAARAPALEPPSTGDLWSVVLAGGWGVRLRPLTRLICGDDRPKQYVALTGSRSLLRQTLDRSRRRISPQRTVVVSLQAQSEYLAAAMPGQGSSVLLQPFERGTAAGVLLPAHWIRARAPEATVAFFPSDHLVVEEDLFMEHVADAADFVDRHPERILLLGAPATEPETEYGWIEPGPPLNRSGRPVRAVHRFVEKPSAEVARACLAAGACWNTFVFVAKARALVEIGRQRVPRVHAVLERMVHASGRRASLDALWRGYAGMPTANFSRDVLESVPARLAVTPLAGVTWSDWGSPRRVVASLLRMGLRPSWLEHLSDPGSLDPGT